MLGPKMSPLIFVLAPFLILLWIICSMNTNIHMISRENPASGFSVMPQFGNRSGSVPLCHTEGANQLSFKSSQLYELCW